MDEEQRRTLPTGVVAFFLTDIEGSTAAWEADPGAMRAALERHDEIVDDVVTHGGGVVLKHKGEGDATLSVFQRVSSATATGLALQEALHAEEWPTAEPLRVRIAIHVGEAHERGGDYFGPTLNRAARLRSIASGGQIVVSATVAALVQDELPPGAALIDLGEHALRGMSRPEPTFELTRARQPDEAALAHAPEPAPQDPPPQLPGGLRVSGEVVGREPELNVLRRMWETARSDGPRGVFLGGEPGIGKTTLAAAFADEVSEGATVVFGRCDQEASLPYQPFAEVVGQLLRQWPDLLTDPAVAAVAEDLARLVPHLLGAAVGRTAGGEDAEVERYRMFHAMVVVLREASRRKPLLLVVDDAHWADDASVHLLRHVLQSDQLLRVLVCATYRTADVDRAGILAPLITDCRHKLGGEHVLLAGLDVPAIGMLVADKLDTPVDDERVREIAGVLHGHTGGNALFVHELLAHTSSAGVDSFGVGDVPETIRETVDRRLARWPATDRDVLTTAAVVGMRFDLPVIEAVLGDTGDAALDAVEEAVRAGLVVEDDGSRFRFAHALIRDAVLAQLTATRRARLHRRVAESLEALPDAPDHAVALAHHFAEAADAARAGAWAVEAANESLRQLTDDSALAIAARALALLDGQRVVDRRLRGELLLCRGRAQTEDGTPATRRATLALAIEDARAAGAADLLARIAVVLDEWTSDTDDLDLEWAALAQESLDALGEESPGVRAQLLARLAWGLIASGRDVAEAAPLAAEAIEIGRAAGDADAVAVGLCVQAMSLFGTGAAEERLATITEAQRQRATTPTWMVRRLLVPAHLEVGDRDGFRREVADFVADLRGQRVQPAAAFLASYDALDAFLDGRFDDAERYVDEVGVAAGSTSWGPLIAIWTGQLYWLHRERGMVADLLPLLADAVDQTPAIIGFRSALALTLAETGDLGAAAEHLRVFHDLRASDVRGDATAAVALSQLAETAARVRDAAAAAHLYELLRPHGGHLLVVGWGVLCAGAADRFLGMLAATMGDDALADHHYDSALALEAQVQAPPLPCRTRLWRGLLHGDGRALAAVAADADTLGMGAVATEARDLALRLPPM